MRLDYDVLRKVKGNPSAETATGRRLQLDPELKEYHYDMPKELIAVVINQFPPERWVKLDGETDDEFLKRMANEFMVFLMDKADLDEYRDRTGEMINLVAQQTGISFPHRFERYLELGVLSLRPRDPWKIAQATTKVVKLRSYNCSLAKLFSERGITQCEKFCLAGAGVIAERIGETLTMEKTAQADPDGYCELTFSRNAK